MPFVEFRPFVVREMGWGWGFFVTLRAMRNLLWVILALALLATAGGTGCRRAARYDARLVAADSLMHDAPDSALAIVQAVCPDSLTHEGDRAYRDLLLTQARYRCYITATSDSAINRALDYYRRHSTEREKLTRAYIYKGAVMEELGQPDSAMLYYKHAEATAAPDDHFNLGYTNLRIAQLYQTYYTNDSAVVNRMRKAAHHFSITTDTTYLITPFGVLGGYSYLLGKDSARFYLGKAIALARAIHSTKGLQFQSKLAGTYFYEGDFQRAKSLAMEIVKDERREKCDENQFYYYAARSYIHLGLLDSARWLITSVIPAPVFAVDSMNHFQTMAELSMAEHHFNAYRHYSEQAKEIDMRLLDGSRQSRLTMTELTWEATNRENLLREKYNSGIWQIAVISASVFVALICALWLFMRWKKRRRQKELDGFRLELQRMIDEAEIRAGMLEKELIAQEHQLAEKKRQLREVTMRNRKLESRHSDLSKRVSEVVRHRNNAFRELYAELRVKPNVDEKGRPVPLFSLIKELNENKRILRKTPKLSFWNNLKLSVDGEFNGIASFVQENYRNLTLNDHHLFWLLCAGVPNPIIRLCMDYANDRTVSNNKKRLINDKMGFEGDLDDFINNYLTQK